MLVGWRQVSRLDFRLLRIFPVIVGCDQGAIWIVQFKSWILQSICNSEVSQRWPNRAQDNIRAFIRRPAQNEAADHDVVAGLDKATSADIPQFGIGRLVAII